METTTGPFVVTASMRGCSLLVGSGWKPFNFNQPRIRFCYFHHIQGYLWLVCVHHLTFCDSYHLKQPWYRHVKDHTYHSIQGQMYPSYAFRLKMSRTWSWFSAMIPVSNSIPTLSTSLAGHNHLQKSLKGKKHCSLSIWLCSHLQPSDRVWLCGISRHDSCPRAGCRVYQVLVVKSRFHFSPIRWSFFIIFQQASPP